MLFEMDKVIGSLVDSIEQRGLANETIIIFSSDNGGINALSYAERKLRGHKGKKIIYWAYCTIYSISEF
jgi:arylsulfatase A-like enzyme